ncbi:cytochrome B [Alteromonas sediminis]|uniref:Cytochrome B n=1 Tax=Alteromonas sediminis TaxID=2259342 RepID=A0A3N5YNG7_9ALTE|nr:cytochrome b/b6 domain-containing protein [Alteromonas sediminis]RPJ67151.1 cytochrome B [Alteromonas sediminis]
MQPINDFMDQQTQTIWDIPVRICHWAIVLLVIAQWVTAELLDDAIQWHAWFGYGLLGVVVFRLLWGFIGSRYARFGQFLASPKTVLHYLVATFKGEAPTYTGHNPLGGWMALFLLLVLLVQSITGLFMTDEIFFSAPYFSAVSSDVQSLMNTLHHQAFTVIQIAVLLHVIAALIYVFVKKQPIIKAMVTGKKPTPESGISHDYWLKLIVSIIVICVLLYLTVVVWPPEQEALWMY